MRETGPLIPIHAPTPIPTDEIMQGYGVLGVPTYLFFTPEGEEAERLVGFVPWEEFLREMKAAAEG